MEQGPVTVCGSGVTPYLCVDGAGAAITFYGNVFGARERVRLPAPDGRVGHAEMTIGDALVMLCDADARRGWLSPKAIGGTPVTLTIEVEDPDTVCARALAAGARPLSPVGGGTCGGRGGQFEDPFGHRWNIVARSGPVPFAARSRVRAVKGAARRPPP